MNDQSRSTEFLELLEDIRHRVSKRARDVIDHIHKHGRVTTEDIRQMGYTHPPRAVRDAREAGMPIVASRIKGSDGKTIAAYEFGDISEAQLSKVHGRTQLSDALKDELIELHGSKCSIYRVDLPKEELQIDHRIPYEIGGEPEDKDVNGYMLLCSSANRKKSNSCENCDNWTVKDIEVCKGCYWAFPDSDYAHVAMKRERRIDILWQGEDVDEYDALTQEATTAQTTLPEYIKKIISDHLLSGNG